MAMENIKVVLFYPHCLDIGTQINTLDLFCVLILQLPLFLLPSEYAANMRAINNSWRKLTRAQLPVWRGASDWDILLIWKVWAPVELRGHWACLVLKVKLVLGARGVVNGMAFQLSHNLQWAYFTWPLSQGIGQERERFPDHLQN